MRRCRTNPMRHDCGTIKIDFAVVGPLWNASLRFSP
jgi:hypothetical protein